MKKKSKVPSKVPVVPVNKAEGKEVTDLMCKEFDQMSPEEKAKFKEQTLDGLRKSIRNIVEGHSNSNSAPTVPKATSKNGLKNPYALNPHGRAVIPQDDITDLIKQKPLNEQETELLRCRVLEYLKSFALFGYDLNGNRILITSCKNTQEKDSIFSMSTHLPPVLFQIFNGREPGENDGAMFQ